MTNLGCDVSSCTHNEDKCCCLSSINVDGVSACKCDDTCCGSFREKRGNAVNLSQTPKIDLSISCDATNCVYNEGRHCSAEHVDINGVNASNKCDTVCQTFSSR